MAAMMKMISGVKGCNRDQGHDNKWIKYKLNAHMQYGITTKVLIRKKINPFLLQIQCRYSQILHLLF